MVKTKQITMTRKSLLKATVLCLAMMACCVTFSACSSDENEPETIITNELTTIKAEYSVSLSEDWYRFFDIEVTYTSETGVKTILLTEDWNFDMNIPYTAGPDEFVCQVTAKPKADMPAIEENASYLLEENIQVRVNGILEDGTMSSEYGYSGNRSGTETKSSEGMKKYVTGEHSLMKFTYTPEK